MGEELKVVIADTTYSLVEIPPSDTQVVLAERKNLLGHIDLKTLVEDLGLVGKCIRVAYNGVTAGGPELCQLQIKIQDLGYDVTKLCDKSAITVSKFKRACATILTDLQVTYEYLVDNFEDMALDTLAAVSEIAGQMAAAAEELHQDFDRQANKVREVQIETEEEKVKNAKDAKDREVEKFEIEKKHEEQQMDLEKARRKEEEAEAKYREYEMKEDEAIAALGEKGNFFTKVVNGVSSKLLDKRVIGEEEATKEQRLQEWKRKKLEALEARQKCEDLRRKASEQLIEFAVSIKKCEGEKEMAEAAVKALHHAIGGLKALAALMMQAALFWKQMQEHCKALGNDEMKKTVAKAISEFDEAKRRRLWTSPGFKTKAVRFYAGWVALDGVCGEYMSGIRYTQRELYKYITENPSYEEAKRNVPELAANLDKELRVALKEITEKKFETEKEIQSLRNEENTTSE